MQIIDLTEEHEKLYFVCLEDWSDEMKEAGDHKQNWYVKMQDRGLRVKLALDDDGRVGGMIQYLPIEHSFVAGKDLYFIPCIWVHGHKKGRGDFRKKGMGKALLQAAEDDVKSIGAKGIAAWGLSIPVWMKASWYKKNGYRKADKMGMQLLVWKRFTDDALPPKWIPMKKEAETVDGKVTVTFYHNGWCSAQNIAFERAKRAAVEFGDKVLFREIDTFEPDTIKMCGMADALFIDKKMINTGPPPKYEKLRKIIAKKVRKLK